MPRSAITRPGCRSVCIPCPAGCDAGTSATDRCCRSAIRACGSQDTTRVSPHLPGAWCTSRYNWAPDSRHAIRVRGSLCRSYRHRPARTNMRILFRQCTHGYRAVSLGGVMTLRSSMEYVGRPDSNWGLRMVAAAAPSRLRPVPVAHVARPHATLAEPGSCRPVPGQPGLRSGRHAFVRYVGGRPTAGRRSARPPRRSCCLRAQSGVSGTRVWPRRVTDWTGLRASRLAPGTWATAVGEGVLVGFDQPFGIGARRDVAGATPGLWAT